MSLGIFESVAADHSNQRTAARQALVLSEKRINEKLGKWLETDNHYEFCAKWPYVADQYNAIIKQACEEVGGGDPSLISLKIYESKCPPIKPRDVAITLASSIVQSDKPKFPWEKDDDDEGDLEESENDEEQKTSSDCSKCSCASCSGEGCGCCGDCGDSKKSSFLASRTAAPGGEGGVGFEGPEWTPQEAQGAPHLQPGYNSDNYQICPECGGDHADPSGLCPHCGYNPSRAEWAPEQVSAYPHEVPDAGGHNMPSPYEAAYDPSDQEPPEGGPTVLDALEPNEDKKKKKTSTEWQDNTNLDGPSPKMDKREWTPKTVKKEKINEKDPTDAIKATNDDTLKEIGEDHTETEKLPANKSDAGFDSGGVSKGPSTKTFPKGDQTKPVTRKSISRADFLAQGR